MNPILEIADGRGLEPPQSDNPILAAAAGDTSFFAKDAIEQGLRSNWSGERLAAGLKEVGANPDDYRQAQRAFDLQAARRRAALRGESVSQVFRRKYVPFSDVVGTDFLPDVGSDATLNGSRLFGGRTVGTKEYTQAAERFSRNEATDDDLDRIATYELAQTADQKASKEATFLGSKFAGKLALELGSLGKIAGEMAIGGKALEGAGRALAGARGARVAAAAAPGTVPAVPAVPGLLASAASATPGLAARTFLAPSMYVPLMQQQNARAGRDPNSLAGLPTAFLYGMGTVAVLGRLQKGLDGGSTLGAFKKGLLGSAELQGVDAAAGVLDQFLPQAYQISADDQRWGTLGQLARGVRDGSAGDALEHAAVQVLAFSAFARLHGSEPPQARSLLKDFMDAQAELRKGGDSKADAGARLQKMHDALEAAAFDAPYLNRATAREVLDKEAGDSPALKKYAESLSGAFEPRAGRNATDALADMANVGRPVRDGTQQPQPQQPAARPAPDRPAPPPDPTGPSARAELKADVERAVAEREAAKRSGDLAGARAANERAVAAAAELARPVERTAPPEAPPEAPPVEAPPVEADLPEVVSRLGQPINPRLEAAPLAPGESRREQMARTLAARRGGKPAAAATERVTSLDPDATAKRYEEAAARMRLAQQERLTESDQSLREERDRLYNALANARADQLTPRAREQSGQRISAIDAELNRRRTERQPDESAATDSEAPRVAQDAAESGTSKGTGDTVEAQQRTTGNESPAPEPIDNSPNARQQRVDRHYEELVRAEPSIDAKGDVTDRPEVLADRVASAIEGNRSVPPGQRKAYAAAARRVLARLPAAAVQRVSRALKYVRAFSTPERLTDAAFRYKAARAGIDPDSAAGREAFKKWSDEIGGQHMAGFADAEGGLYVDGVPFGDLPAERFGARDATAEGRGPAEWDNSLEAPYSHELTHLIDGFKKLDDGSYRHELSDRPTWSSEIGAFELEIAPKDGSTPLSEYAKTNPAEGLAEFGRLLYGTDVPLDMVRARFPKAYRFFERHGLLPDRGPAGPAAAAKPTEPPAPPPDAPVLKDTFNKRVEVGDGAHVDLRVRELEAANRRYEAADAAAADWRAAQDAYAAVRDGRVSLADAAAREAALEAADAAAGPEFAAAYAARRNAEINLAEARGYEYGLVERDPSGAVVRVHQRGPTEGRLNTALDSQTVSSFAGRKGADQVNGEWRGRDGSVLRVERVAFDGRKPDAESTRSGFAHRDYRDAKAEYDRLTAEYATASKAGDGPALEALVDRLIELGKSVDTKFPAEADVLYETAKAARLAARELVGGTAKKRGTRKPKGPTEPPPEPARQRLPREKSVAPPEPDSNESARVRAVWDLLSAADRADIARDPDMRAIYEKAGIDFEKSWVNRAAAVADARRARTPEGQVTPEDAGVSERDDAVSYGDDLIAEAALSDGEAASLRGLIDGLSFEQIGSARGASKQAAFNAAKRAVRKIADRVIARIEADPERADEAAAARARFKELLSQDGKALKGVTLERVARAMLRIERSSAGPREEEEVRNSEGVRVNADRYTRGKDELDDGSFDGDAALTNPGGIFSKLLAGGTPDAPSLGRRIRNFFLGKLPASVRLAKEQELDQRIAAHTYDVLVGEKDFRRALKENGLDYDTLTDVQREQLNDLLQTPPSQLAAAAAAAGTPPAVVRQIESFRAQIDRLSDVLLDAGAIPEPLVATVEGNVGTYLTRQYQVFSDAAWESKVDPQVVNRFKGWLVGELARVRDVDPNALDPAEIEGITKSLLRDGTAADNPIAFLRSSQLGSKDLSILSRRKDIPPELRALWGEIKDPLVNYTNSVGKMAHLLASHLFLKRAIAENPSLFSRTRSGELLYELAPKDAQNMGAAAGYYTTKEVRDAFQEALAPAEASAGMRLYLKALAATKFLKVVVSHTGQIANFLSNVGIAVRNGNLRVGKLKETFGELLNDTDAARSEWRRMIELGVVGDEFAYRDFRDVVDAAFKGRESATWFDNLFGGLLKSGAEFAAKTYRYGDSFWKVHNYRAELSKLREAYPKDAPEVLERRAAEIVRDTTPTYSRIPEGLKKLRGLRTVAPFFGFQAEVVRTTTNAVRQALKELRDPATKAIGAKRLAGTLAATLLPTAALLAARALQGVSAQEDEDVRRLLPEYERDGQLLYYGRDEKGRPKYADIGRIDPHAYLLQPVLALLRSGSAGERVARAGGKLADPFVGEELLVRPILDAARNKREPGGQVYNPSDPALDKGLDIAKNFGRAFAPGGYGPARRLAMGLTGTDETSTGKTYDPTNAVLENATALRLKDFDPALALEGKARAFEALKDDAVRPTGRLMRAKGSVGGDELAAAASSSADNRGRAFEEFRKDVTAALRYLSESEVRRVLKSAGVSDGDAAAVIRGTVPVWKPEAAPSGATPLERQRTLAVRRQMMGLR